MPPFAAGDRPPRSLFLLALLGATALQAAGAAPPNVVVIVADDLGFSDLGCYGGEITTPNLDALATGGLRYSQFYNSGRCWPSRAALMTGYYAQQVNRDALPTSKGRGIGNRPAWALTLAERLGGLGYRSYHSGKWHVDGPLLENGFEHAFTVASCERFFNPANNSLDDKPLPQKSLENGKYITTEIADYAIQFIDRHVADHPDQPFFQYVAFTSPHFPLHAIAEDIERYAGRYDDGWDALRAARWETIQETTGLTGRLSALNPKVGPPYHFPDALKVLGPGEVNRELSWDTLSDEQQRFQAIKMSLHAAMVDRMDQEIGRMVAELKRLDRFDNTLILFLSDNGASAEIMVRGDGHDPQAAPGSAASYLCLGPAWARAANTPFRRHKTYVHEGGIATPLIAHWPAGIAEPGQWRRSPGHVIDLTPTVLEAAGHPTPNTFASAEAPPTPGISLTPTFAGASAADRPPLWWLHEGNRAVRYGDWKLVAVRGEPWELFNLGEDRTETNNLAASAPEKAAELKAIWQANAKQFADDLGH